jgi:hypothetical protein
MADKIYWEKSPTSDTVEEGLCLYESAVFIQSTNKSPKLSTHVTSLEMPTNPKLY